MNLEILKEHKLWDKVDIQTHFYSSKVLYDITLNYFSVLIMKYKTHTEKSIIYKYTT